MKAVLISIQPKWCELIASGRKTVEVRKTKPKLETPFKVYIYCTKDNTFAEKTLRGFDENGKALYYKSNKGKVIGEFVCDSFYGIMNFLPYESDDNHHTVLPCVLEQTCLTEDEIDEYLGQKDGYGWHISNLVIYDQPKELTKFIVPSKFGCVNEGKCRGCIYLDRGNGYNVEDDCNAWFSTDDYKPLRKPPQSWCYVEERSGQ
jgi:predicted transcriptional regulator